MSKKNIIILVLSIILLVIAIGIFVFFTFFYKQSNKGKTVATPVPKEKSFYFYDIDGNKIDLKNYEGKPLTILFWKSDSSKSFEMIKLIEKNYEAYKDSINFLAINVNEPDLNLNLIEDVKAVNFKIPIYFDTDLILKEKYNYQKLPSILFIEEDGTIAKEIDETITEDTFLANLELLTLGE